ncbi:MAG: ABC transporter substrate-binding protein [Candidatus Protistobacter heckmanni]|nr:ABC transporter substrate-binding protein [Candidatus Protistobacter heckmanni]
MVSAIRMCRHRIQLKEPMMRKLWLLLALAAGAACTAATALAADAVTVRLKWFNQAQFAGFYIAQENGFYREAGIDAAIQPGGPDFPAIQMVAGGNEQFGVTSADQILVARGKGVPVVAIAVLYRKSPFVLFSLKDSGIDTPDKFRGKKIGVKIGGNEELVYRAVLKKAAVAASSLTEIPVKFDMSPLHTGQIDVWPGYSINEVIAAREKGFAVNVISPASYGLNFYADTLFTTEKMLAEHPDVVKRFVAATIKGWTYAASHPEDAAKASVKFGNKLTYEHELAMMRESIDLLQPDRKPIGSMDPAQWGSLQTLLVEGGLLKAPVALDQAYTTKYLPQ